MIENLLRTIDVRRNELRPFIAAFLFIFVLMCAYYLLRPVRDAMASDWTDAEVSWLWTLNFFISTALVAAYGGIVARLGMRFLVPAVYSLFAASFFAFYLGTTNNVDSGNSATAKLLDQTFYIWVSVFALFHVSVFWSFMADIFNRQQAQRLFGPLSAGASLGAICGPLLAALAVSQMGNGKLLLVAAVLLIVLLPVIFYLQTKPQTVTTENGISSESSFDSKALGGQWLDGFKVLRSNRFLLGIAVFIILYTGIGSFIYLEQKNLLAEFDRDTRTMIYGYRDALVNLITFVLALAVTSRLVKKLGMSFALPAVPFFIVAGMLSLAVAPMLLAALAVHVVAKAGNYGLTKPAREMLFTLVNREDRFKSKPVIDIVAYRGGDVIMAWFFTLLTQGLGLGMAAVAAVGAVLAAVWALVGWFLGRSYQQKFLAQSRS